MKDKRKKSKRSSILRYGCFAYLFLLAAMFACGLLFFGESILQSVPLPASLSLYVPPTPTPEPGKVAGTLVFSGKVISQDASSWLNDRLVVVYLDGQEVGRAITEIGESEFSEEGITDGYFDIFIPNTYKIPENRFDFSRLNVETERGRSLLVFSEQEIWFGDLIEGALYELPVPSKNLTFYVKIFAAKTAFLPPEMLEDGSTFLTENKEIIYALNVAKGDADLAEQIHVQDVKYNLSQEIVEVNREIFPIDNCQGNSPIQQIVSSSKTIYHEYTTETTRGGGVSVNVPVPIPILQPELILELQKTYGFKQGEVDSEFFSTNIEAQPGTSVTYIITWSEIWESGVALVQSGPDVVEVPFQVRKGILRETDSETANCS